MKWKGRKNMEIKKRVNDVNQVFDSQWKVNHNYQEQKQFLDTRKKHFDRMHNIVDKEERKKEILKANSVSGRIQRLEENMKAASGNELLKNRNSFR